MTSLFILSGIEGILESRFPWFPYRLLYKDTDHITPSKNKSELEDSKKENAKLLIRIDDLNKNKATREQEILAQNKVKKSELEDSKKEYANIQIKMQDLKESLAAKELLLREKSSPGPEVSCVEDPLNVQSKQSDLDCSVDSIESQNVNSSKQQHEEKSLDQGN